MFLKTIFILISIISVSYADVADLEQLIKDLNNKPVELYPPKIPEWKPAETNFLQFGLIDIFDSDLLGESSVANNYLQQYNLNQVQMVGYMNYKKVNYAFLKTQYETLQVKVGDKMQNGVVARVDKESVEIVEQHIINNKVFDKKIFIKLEEPKNNKTIRFENQQNSVNTKSNNKQNNKDMKFPV